MAKSKLEAFHLYFEVNETIAEQRRKLKRRTKKS